MSGNQSGSDRPNGAEQGRERFLSFDSNSSAQSFHSIARSNSTASFNSIASTNSTASFRSAENPPRGNARPRRNGALERIVEAAVAIAELRPTRRQPEEPFAWAELAGPATSLAREALNSYRDHKRSSAERQAQWERQRDKDMRTKRDSSIPRDPQQGKFDTSKIPMRKNKNDNPALRLLAEHEERQRTKRIMELKRQGTTSFEVPGTPLPPYVPRYKIPEDIYEELELKRLKDSLYAGDSDPEVARHRCKPGKVYPTLPEEDYDYVQFGGIRRWASTTDKSPKKNRTMRKKLTPPRTDNSDSDSDYDKIEYVRPLLRLKGGAGSSSGSTDAAASRVSQDKKRKQTESEVNSQDMDVEVQSKHKKTNKHSALNDTSPGIGANQIMYHLTECRDIGKEFSTILALEKEKKRLSVKAVSDLATVQQRYEELIDDLITENSLIMGRLLEARAATTTIHQSDQSSGRQQSQKMNKKKTPEPKTKANELASTSQQGTSSMKNDDRPRTQTYAEKVRFRDPITTDTDGQTSDNFTVFTGRRKKRTKKQGAKSTSGTDSGTHSRPTAENLRKVKIQELKSIEPPKSFTVKVGDQGASEVKKGLWAEILKKNNAPNIESTRILPKGDIRIVPADNATYEALKAICQERTDVKRTETRWPMVMIHDVDESIPGDTVASTLAIQNPSLGIGVQEAIEAIKPLFKRGPRGKDVHHWVCSVKPEVYTKLVNKSVFIGMARCRVTEYYDYNQCFMCLQYGHRTADCKQTIATCGHCSGKGHKVSECDKKDNPPKCSNCGKAHEAISNLCKERAKAVNNFLRRTSYGPSQ